MGKYNISTLDNPKSHVSEAYRTLRTNILFSSSDNKIRTLVVTSSSPDEGKTTVSVNLAVTMAQAGSKTIVLDCDMRSPKIHRLFKLSNVLGLSDLLIGEAGIDDVVQDTGIEGLYLLSAGTRPPNPAELLTSERMKKLIREIKQQFDYAVIDTPPILMVTDAQIISKYVDGSLIVIGAGETERDLVVKARELLKKVNAKILGVVLNKHDTGKIYNKKHSHYYVEPIKSRRKKKIKNYEQLRDK